ncbi:unnamed protein product, partial [Mesorhabditis spiculigera]
MRYLALFFIFTTSIEGIRRKYADCFSHTTRKTLDNYEPIAAFELVSLQTCMLQCIEAPLNFENKECFSFTYDRIKHNCKIYDHDGKKVPAILLPAMNFDFYKKIHVGEACAPPKPQIIYTEPDAEPDPTTNFAEHKNFHNIEEELLKATKELLNRRASKTAKKKDSEQIENPKMMPIMPGKCETTNGYYVVIGNEILLPSGFDKNAMREFPGIEQGDCASICSKEESPEGEKLKCNSLNYFPITRKCQILAVLAEPHGEGELVENEDSIYAEKFCLPKHPNECQEAEVFILHIEKRIKGTPMKEKLSQSITQCLEACLNEDGCATSVFDSARGRCLLHTQQVGRDLGITENTSGFVLIENGCYVKGKRKTEKVESPRDPNEWSPWSDCQFKLNGKAIRSRTRDCEDCEDFQYEECQ